MAGKYFSRNFKATCWRQNTKIMLNDKHVGDVDVYYIQAPPKVDGEPFLEEEGRLLRAIASV